jgi:hypothetical protein
MKYGVALISALLASFSGTANAEIIFANGKHSARQPTIIRGAPHRCHAKRPLVINVQDSLKNAGRNVVQCAPKIKTAQHSRSIVNIIVIAGRHERLYIKHY